MQLNLIHLRVPVIFSFIHYTHTHTHTLSLFSRLPPASRSLAFPLVRSPIVSSLSLSLLRFSVTLAHTLRVVSFPLSLSLSSISVSFHDCAPHARRSERRVRERTKTAPPPRLTRSLRPLTPSLSTYLSISLGLSRPSRQPNVGISRNGGIAGTRIRYALPRKGAG